MSAVPTPRFDSVDIGLADTPVPSDFEETTRKSRVDPVTGVVTKTYPVVAAPAIARRVRHSVWHRIRVWLRDLVDPRDPEEVLAERRVLEASVAEYHGEVDWHARHSEPGLFGVYKNAQIARWTSTAALVRARKKAGAR